MSLSYFPMYPTDFDADTGHLSLAEDGAYNRLLRLSWRCPGAMMPDDLDWICRKSRVTTPEDRALIEAILAEFFTRKAGKIFSKRLAQEYAKAHAAHEKRILAGSSGGKAKALKVNATLSSNATALPYQPEPEPEPEPEKKERDAIASPKKAVRGSRLGPDWTLPDDWRQWALDQGLTGPVINREADRFRDYWIGKSGKDAAKADWQATWRNWVRKLVDGVQARPVPQGDFWTGKVLAG